MTAAILLSLTLILTVSLQEGYCVDSLPRQEAELNADYIFGWEVNGEKGTITVDVKARTTGWVGFGIAPKANMNGADVVIGGINDNGTMYFADRFARGKTEPEIDEKQDWTVNEIYEDGEYTYLNITRALETCDDMDLPITSDTLNVIWSYGATDKIEHHKNRGGSQFNLLDPEALPFDPNNFAEDQVWKVRVNHTLEPEDTIYWCTIHQFPKFEKKHHLVAVEAFLKDANSVKHTHHFTATSCDLKDPEVLAIVQELHNDKYGKNCYGAEFMRIRHKCNAILFGWAVGGKRIVLPDYLGVPVGEEGVGDANEYVMFEVHYDNPDLSEGVEFESGFNLYFTDELREKEGSVMVVGTNILPSLMIPPGQADFTISGHCSSEMTREFFPEDGLNVVIVNMHSHLAGRELRVRHFRDGKELPWMLSDSHYDFDYQQARLLPQEIKILPGDHLTMECKMSTSDRKVVTLAGDGSLDEMCHAFLFYYPRIDLMGCRSYYPVDKMLQKFGIYATQDPLNDPKNVNDPIIALPLEHLGKRISEVMNAFNWTQDFVNDLQEKLRYGDHISNFLFSSVSKRSMILSAGPTNYTRYPGVPVYEPQTTCSSDGGNGETPGSGEDDGKPGSGASDEKPGNEGGSGSGTILSSAVLAVISVYLTVLVF